MKRHDFSSISIFAISSNCANDVAFINTCWFCSLNYIISGLRFSRIIPYFVLKITSTRPLFLKSFVKSTTIFHTIKVPRISTYRCTLMVWSTGCRPSSCPHRAESMPGSFRSTHSCALYASFHGATMWMKSISNCIRWEVFPSLTTRRYRTTTSFSSRTGCGNSTVFQLCNIIMGHTRKWNFIVNWNWCDRSFF